MLIGNTIGGFGGARLGNQIWQISLLFSIWKKTNAPFFQPNKGEMFWDCFEADIVKIGTVNKKINYGCAYEYFSDVYTKNGVELGGYFQNLLYVQDIKYDLIDFLKFKPEHENYSTRIITEIEKKYNLPLASLHIRRGDYIQSENILGNLIKSNYYQDSIDSIQESVCYLIFSDDIDWCRNNFKINNCEYIQTDPYKSLCIMTKTKYNIIANSTFSWWGAFLNKNSITYIPSKWTGKQDYSDCGKFQNFKLPEWRGILVEWNS